ncbi:MAG: RNA-binding domain-containing protein [Alphaproteobacteria bacterium]
MSIEELIKQYEGKTLEFKENSLPKAKILSTIIAFANTSGGYVVLGVQDKTHYIVGIDKPHEVAEELANLIHDVIEPRILPNIDVIPYKNTHLIIIKVYPSPLRPHFKRAEGKLKSTYIRLGSTTRLVDNDLLRAIERSVAAKTFDEEPCCEASYEDIDFTAAAQLFKPFRKINTNDLVTLGVFIKDRNRFVPTVGGILLFSPQRLLIFPDAWIQLGVFEGFDKTNIVNSQKITSLLPQAVDEAMEFIKKNIRVGIDVEDIRHKEL